MTKKLNSLQRALKDNHVTLSALIQGMGYSTKTHFTFWKEKLSSDGKRKMTFEELELVIKTLMKLTGKEAESFGIVYDVDKLVLK